MSNLINPILVYLYVFLGGGIGASLRYGWGQIAAKLVGTEFPYGTLSINIVGSFMMGVITSYLYQIDHSQELKLFLTVGILGGFTTFSAFSVETALLWQREAFVAAITYILLSVILSLTAVGLGLATIKLYR